MRCERHDLAAGPDGRCALCRREEQALSRAMGRRRDPARRVAIVVLGILVGAVVFVLLTAVFDTK
jgi:hypothetical protein